MHLPPLIHYILFPIKLKKIWYLNFQLEFSICFEYFENLRTII